VEFPKRGHTRSIPVALPDASSVLTGTNRRNITER
jgi:hypothetical protein